MRAVGLFRRRSHGPIGNLDPNVERLVNMSYSRAPEALSHLRSVVGAYPSLKAVLETIRAQSGDHQIVNITGTIPITFKGATYNIPVLLRVLPNYPAGGPIMFLTPTPNMGIVRRHRNVDNQGRCYFPYLSQWNPHKSNIVELIEKAIEGFSEAPPLFSKPQPLPPQPPPSAQPTIIHPRPTPTPSQHNAYNSNSSNSNANPIPPNSNPKPVYVNDPTIHVSETAQKLVDSTSGKDDSYDSDEDAKLCIICFDKPKEALITPCNHIALCMTDAMYMKNHGQKCPVCRGDIGNVIRVFVV